jgi:hypothetical protein
MWMKTRFLMMFLVLGDYRGMGSKSQWFFVLHAARRTGGGASIRSAARSFGIPTQRVGMRGFGAWG